MAARPRKVNNSCRNYVYNREDNSIHYIYILFNHSIRYIVYIFVSVYVTATVSSPIWKTVKK